MKPSSLIRALSLLAVLLAVGCNAPPPPAKVREFPLTGEVLAVKPDKSEVQVKHDEVKGFMDAMTMWFNIKDPSLLDGIAPGDLISATLVLTAEDSYLTAVRKTGSRPPGGAPAPPPAPAEILPIGAAVPDIVFSDEAGKPRPLSSYRGTYTLLTFIYIRCPLPDYCPRMNAHFAAVQRGLKADPLLGRNVRLLSVSFDPEFDTPARLAAKAREMGADPALWHFVTAPRARVDEFGARLGLSVLREGADGSNITHNLRTALLDRDGRLARPPAETAIDPVPVTKPPSAMAQECDMSEMVLLADEAVALAAVHAGLTAAYGYPGTPSTEILEYLIRYRLKHGGPRAEWCANEKTAYEAALGVSYAGRRTMVTMKHVGLNVAADPFMNSALVTVNGGLVVAVADDPGMHSSQNEQDSRVFADFARVVCLEPASHQEAYDMTREAFDISERFHIPVMIRLVTRLAHSRGIVQVGDARGENPPHKQAQASAWVLLPGNARRQWRALLDRFNDIRAYVAASRFNTAEAGADGGFGVITAGLARNYFVENLEDLPSRPAHLHVGAYPYPAETIRAFVAPLTRVLLLEEGYPYIERALRGIVPPGQLDIQGRESGAVPPDGELNPDIVRTALGLPARTGVTVPGLSLPNRPPQLCAGCPHGDSFHSITAALAAFPDAIVTADIGCSTLGALPPYNAIETCVCMGASVGMAKGAADAGYHPVVAVIGDSTFLHSGVTPLMDAVAADTPMTLLILDNKTVAMTGGQPTIRTSSELEALVRGLGVPPDHMHVVEAHPRRMAENTEILRREVNHRGLSVIIGVRECIETAKRSRQEKTVAAARE